MNQQPPGSSPIPDIVTKLLGMPAPQDILAELQRLNNNLEMMSPDLHNLTSALGALQGNDIKNLTAALNAIRVGDLLRTLNEFSGLAKQIYERLWGKK